MEALKGSAKGGVIGIIIGAAIAIFYVFKFAIPFYKWLFSLLCRIDFKTGWGIFYLVIFILLTVAQSWLFYMLYGIVFNKPPVYNGTN
ncbi:MAG: hypothetical protein ACI8XB_001662 [Patiriisocius sp.]|jgi:hypothetical protein